MKTRIGIGKFTLSRERTALLNILVPIAFPFQISKEKPWERVCRSLSERQAILPVTWIFNKSNDARKELISV